MLESAPLELNPAETAPVGEAGAVSAAAGRPKGIPKWAKTVLRLVVAAVVLAAVGRQIGLTWGRWQAKSALFEINPTLLVGSGVFYIAGLVAFGLYYWQVVKLVEPRACVMPCMKAYILSHPAKYVPGKAMVVVIRVGLLARHGVRPTAGMLTALYETLSMMAIGGLLGGLLLVLPPAHPLGALACAGLGVAFLGTVLPWTFGTAVKLLKKGLHAIEPADMPVVRGRAVGPLVFWGVLGWGFWGMSQVLVVAGLSPGHELSIQLWPRVMGGMMLGTVGGFALPVLPGGLGLREWVINEVTGGVLGPDLAIASALGLRFVWVVAELFAAALVAVLPGAEEIPKTRDELAKA